MRHPTDGTLRRLLDEPAGVPDNDREHVAGCPACLARLAAAREDAAAAGAALDVELAVDVDSAWQRLSHSIAAGGRGRAPAAKSADRWRTALRSPAVAALCVVAVLFGAGAVAAADWVQIFQTERVAPVAITRTDLLELPDLSAYGDLEVTQEADVRTVADADAAEEATGLSVPRVSELPRGVTGEPELQVGSRATAVFTFSVEQAAQMAAEYDEALPPPPPGLDGSRFRLNAGPGLQPSGRRRAASPPSSSLVRWHPPRSPRASRSRRPATTSCPCLGFPTMSRRSCAASPATERRSPYLCRTTE